MARRLNTDCLKDTVAWALLHYSDGSEICFQTTLSPKILREKDIVLQEGKLVRLDKQYFIGGRFVYRQYPFSSAVVSVWDNIHYTDELSYKLHDFL